MGAFTRRPGRPLQSCFYSHFVFVPRREQISSHARRRRAPKKTIRTPGHNCASRLGPLRDTFEAKISIDAGLDRAPPCLGDRGLRLAFWPPPIETQQSNARAVILAMSRYGRSLRRDQESQYLPNKDPTFKMSGSAESALVRVARWHGCKSFTCLLQRVGQRRIFGAVRASRAYYKKCVRGLSY